MTISSLLKELKLLCRDLHGLAVLFVMPIAFMPDYVVGTEP